MARCELAPGSPWNAIRLAVLMMVPWGSGTHTGARKSTSRSQPIPCQSEVGRRVDAERYRVDDGDVDAHAGLERAQLLEPFTLLERGRGQADEAGERGAPIGVDSDVVIERAVTAGRLRAGEIERPQPA